MTDIQDERVIAELLSDLLGTESREEWMASTFGADQPSSRIFVRLEDAARSLRRSER